MFHVSHLTSLACLVIHALSMYILDQVLQLCRWFWQLKDTCNEIYFYYSKQVEKGESFEFWYFVVFFDREMGGLLIIIAWTSVARFTTIGRYALKKTPPFKSPFYNHLSHSNWLIAFTKFVSKRFHLNFYVIWCEIKELNEFYLCQ